MSIKNWKSRNRISSWCILWTNLPIFSPLIGTAIFTLSLYSGKVSLVNWLHFQLIMNTFWAFDSFNKRTAPLLDQLSTSFRQPWTKKYVWLLNVNKLDKNICYITCKPQRSSSSNEIADIILSNSFLLTHEKYFRVIAFITFLSALRFILRYCDKNP